MNGENNSLGNKTGGNAPTGNPQDIGRQSIVSTQSNLQPTEISLFNGTKLRLTDQNGQALAASTQTATTIVTPKSELTPRNNHRPIIIGIGLLIIVAVFIATWSMNRSHNLSKH